MVRKMGKNMANNEIQGYEPLVDELKQLIHKKQYHVLKTINAETINLYCIDISVLVYGKHPLPLP